MWITQCVLLPKIWNKIQNKISIILPTMSTSGRMSLLRRLSTNTTAALPAMAAQKLQSRSFTRPQSYVSVQIPALLIVMAANPPTSTCPNLLASAEKRKNSSELVCGGGTPRTTLCITEGWIKDRLNLKLHSKGELRMSTKNIWPRPRSQIPYCFMAQLYAVAARTIVAVVQVVAKVY